MVMDNETIIQLIQLYSLRIIGAAITLIVGYLVACWIKRRFNETFSISYSDDIGKAIDIVNGVLKSEDKVLEESATMVEVLPG